MSVIQKEQDVVMEVLRIMMRLNDEEAQRRILVCAAIMLRIADPRTPMEAFKR